MKHKEEFLLQSNDGNSQNLLQLMDSLSDLEIQKKEVTEAIGSGEAAQTELGSVINSLESAQDWGTWDILGGGLLATAAKHSHIDEANEYAHQTKIALNDFKMNYPM